MDDDVDAAVPLAQVLDQPLPRVVRGDVELERRAADLVRDLGQLVAGRRDVDGDDVRAVPGHDAGDRRADAAGGTGDDGDLGGQGLLAVLTGGRSAAESVTTWPST